MHCPGHIVTYLAVAMNVRLFDLLRGADCCIFSQETYSTEYLSYVKVRIRIHIGYISNYKDSLLVTKGKTVVGFEQLSYFLLGRVKAIQHNCLDC